MAQPCLHDILIGYAARVEGNVIDAEFVCTDRNGPHSFYLDIGPTINNVEGEQYLGVRLSVHRSMPTNRSNR